MLKTAGFAPQRIAQDLELRTVNLDFVDEETGTAILESLLDNHRIHPFGLRHIDYAPIPRMEYYRRNMPRILKNHRNFILMASTSNAALVLNSERIIRNGYTHENFQALWHRYLRPYPYTSTQYARSYREFLNMVVTHEVAHFYYEEFKLALGYTRTQSLRNPRRGTWMDNRRRAHPELADAIDAMGVILSRSNISRYGNTCAEEGFVEGYAIWRHHPEKLSNELRIAYSIFSETFLRSA